MPFRGPALHVSHACVASAILNHERADAQEIADVSDSAALADLCSVRLGGEDEEPARTVRRGRAGRPAARFGRHSPAQG